MAITKKKNICKGEAQDSETINYRFLRECRKEIRKRDRARYMRNQARNRLFSMVYANLFLVLATTIVCLYVYFKCKQIAMENAPSFKVPNFNIPDTKSAKHLPDSKAASNLTHGNVASTVVSHFVHLQNKLIMTDNATSRNDQNINISDVKSIKHLPDAKAASNLTHGNVNLLTFSYRIENEDFILKPMCIISVILLIISIAIVPIVTYNNNEDNAIYNDLM